ncbi:hypothetical protein J421_4669 (plasmid) [Gemmatirosa kalamazoonensis]|uniref:Peptidase C39-like domain-containing protein n=1 Tax=Gemmatirosa kalamazoonensis TaxID=861299 RepID=W0RMY2_9BACT|nr:hypothetical protein [Gemmatirosa kalamazoonensis]AHG92136.1 hypothetical protein J421_4601 [Gemmatirosa kalamazoonensis]AHG92204.1 hypothetical protein J421_4669 [Gemmatirosa kalamazoonensis]
MIALNADAPAAIACADCADQKARLILHRGTGERHRMPCACTATDLPVKFVYQPENSGCVVAAVAMIIGKTYFETKQYFVAHNDFTVEGAHRYQWQEVLDAHGFAWRLRFDYLSRLNGARRESWPCAPWADLHLVEVINTRGSGQHAVVLLRDGRVLDPWWGVLQGLHRYPRVVSMTAVYRVDPPGGAGA